MKRLFTFRISIALLLSCFVSSAQITPFPWVPIGPKGDLVSDVQRIGVNGRIRSMEIRDLVGGDFYIYAGASSGGLWRSRRSSRVWANLGNKLFNPSIGALAVSPGDPDDILVGTGDWQRYAGEGMFHTVDGGLNWTKVLLSPAPTNFFRLLYLPGNANVVLAATDVGLFRTENGPDNPLNNGWTLMLPGQVTDLAIDPQNPQIQYACLLFTGGLGGGVYKSVNGGKNWMLFTSADAPPNRVGRGSISICRDFPNNLVFVYENGCQTADVLKSTDAGVSWSSITNNLLSLGGAGNGLPGQACHAQAIAFRPNNPSQIFLGVVDFFHTDDGGQNWIKWQPPNRTHGDFNQLYFSPVTGDDLLWECSDGGIYLSAPTDDTSWSFNGDNQTGLQVSQINDMDATHGIRVIGNQDDQAAGSSDGGQNWYSAGCCDVPTVAITYDFFLPSYWYILTSGALAGKVFNHAIGFSPVEVSDPNRALAGLFYNRFEDKVYSLDPNSGLVSRLASASIPGPWTPEANLAMGTGGLAGDRLNGQTLFGWGASPGVLTVLKHNGNWSVAWNAPIGIANGSANAIKSVFASTERPGESWAGLRAATTNQILHTTDDWQTWSDITGNLASFGTNFAVWDLAVMPFNPKVIFLTMDTGVVFTQNGGATWEGFQTGLPRVQCRRVRYVTDANLSGSDKLVVATFGHGMYERLIPRPPLVYVDLRNAGWEDGTLEHPFGALNTGLSTTPPNGMMALNGMRTYIAPSMLTQPMTITAYEAPARLTR